MSEAEHPSQLDIARGLRAVLDELCFTTYPGEWTINEQTVAKDTDLPRLVEIFQKAAVNEKKDV